MAESKKRKGFDDKQDKTRFHSSQTSFLLFVVKQIRESAILIPDCNPNDVLKLATKIVKLSNALEHYKKIEGTTATKKEKMASDYSRIIKKMKKKRKLSYYYYLKNKRMAELYKEYYNKKEITAPNHLIPKNKPEESKQERQLRLNHSKQKLKQEIQILESRRDTYGKKMMMVMVDNEIDTIIMKKYEKDPIKKEFFEN